MWKNKAISKSTKFKLYETLILSILCYNSETLTLTAKTKWTVESVWNGLSAEDFGSYTQRPHFELRHQSQTQARRWYIVEKIQTNRLRYFGHVTRIMDKCRLPYIALYGRVEGNRAKGRPRKRWLDNVAEVCKRRGWDIVEVGMSSISNCVCCSPLSTSLDRISSSSSSRGRTDGALYKFTVNKHCSHNPL